MRERNVRCSAAALRDLAGSIVRKCHGWKGGWSGGGKLRPRRERVTLLRSLFAKGASVRTVGSSKLVTPARYR